MDSPDSNQFERQYLKNLVELEKLNHFQVLEAVSPDTAHLQDIDAALNALGGDIGQSLDWCVP